VRRLQAFAEPTLIDVSASEGSRGNAPQSTENGPMGVIPHAHIRLRRRQSILTKLPESKTGRLLVAQHRSAEYFPN